MSSIGGSLGSVHFLLGVTWQQSALFLHFCNCQQKHRVWGQAVPRDTIDTTAKPLPLLQVRGALALAGQGEAFENDLRRPSACPMLQLSNWVVLIIRNCSDTFLWLRVSCSELLVNKLCQGNQNPSLIL